MEVDHRAGQGQNHAHPLQAAQPFPQEEQAQQGNGHGGKVEEQADRRRRQAGQGNELGALGDGVVDHAQRQQAQPVGAAQAAQNGPPCRVEQHQRQQHQEGQGVAQAGEGQRRDVLPQPDLDQDK